MRENKCKKCYIAKPWTNSSLIRRANLFQSLKCIGFNFTLRAFRYQLEERVEKERGWERERDKEEGRKNS